MIDGSNIVVIKNIEPLASRIQDENTARVLQEVRVFLESG
jgi:hypothetical protein